MNPVPKPLLRSAICSCLLVGVLVSSIAITLQAQNTKSFCDEVLIALDDMTLSSSRRSQYLDSLSTELQQDGNICALLCARVQQAAALDDLSMPDSALAQLYWANGAYSGQCDSSIVFDIYHNLSSVYLSLSEYDRVDSVSMVMEAGWNPGRGDIGSRLGILTNRAIALAYEGYLDQSLIIFRGVLTEAQTASSEAYIQRSLVNIGTIKGAIGEIDSAAWYLNRAALYGDDDIRSVMTGFINLSLVYFEEGDFDKAQIALDSAYSVASRLEELSVLASVYDLRADIFAEQGRYAQAYDQLRNFTDMSEDLINEERLAAAAEMMERYESEKKAREIQELKLDKIDAELENQRVTNTRNMSFLIGLVVLIGAIGLGSRLRLVRRSKAVIEKERDLSDTLLRNILPESVAAELKTKGSAQAELFESATILFTDFSKFTEISGRMSASDLVALLNEYFKAFDEITTTHGLEKIKTIGDAYMATAGIPTTNVAGVADVVLAALDMMDFVSTMYANDNNATPLHFEMRAGIDTGPVVAGIVGVKKFQYDIWGDAVNLASRMETNGAPGRVNISQATYDLIGDDQRFVFESRGKISVKGKGDVSMFYVSRANP